MIEPKIEEEYKPFTTRDTGNKAEGEAQNGSTADSPKVSHLFGQEQGD